MVEISALELANTIHAIGALVSRSGDLGAALEAICRRVLEELDAGYVGIVLVDRATETLVHHAGAVADGEVPRDHRQRLGDGVIGQVVRTGEPIIIGDTLDSDLYVQAVPGMRSELAVPLVLDGDVLGALNVESPEVGAFGLTERALLLAVSTSVAQAIETGRLFQEDRRRLKQLTMLNRVSHILVSTLSLDDLLARTVETIREQLDYYLVAIALVTEDQRIELRAIACRGALDVQPGYSQALGEGVSGEVVETGQPLLIPDTREWFNYLPATDAVRCEMCVPLRIGDRVIGTLDVESTVPNAFDYADLLLLETVGDHISQAIENARNLRRLSERRGSLGDKILRELRGPLGTLRRAFDALEARGDGGGALSEARGALAELLDLTDGLELLARLRSGEIDLNVSADVAELLSGVVKRVIGVAEERRIALETRFAGDLPEARLDVDLIARTLQNLVTASLELTPTDGCVVIAVSLADDDDRRRAPGGAVALRFDVHGSGELAPDQTDLLERRASGLGLSFCRNAVKAHGGALRLEAADGGHRFVMVLPIATDA